jgi:hypothetical protein
VHRPLTADGTITAGPSQGSAYAAVMVTGSHGTRMQWNYTGDTAGLAGGTQSGDPTDATAAFARVSLAGRWAASAWTGTAVTGGGNSQYPTGSKAGYRQADGAFTVSGSGDIAPGAIGGTPVNQELAGLFIGLIAVVVAGALFITAECRRGMIRLTFAAGLIGAAGAMWAGDRLLVRNGSAIDPATALTEIRVIAGTAALVAVFAVFALGVGAILRQGAGTVTIVITAIIVPYLLAAVSPVLPAGAADWLLRLTPAAGFAVLQAIPAYPQVAASYTPFQGYFPLAPWAGFAVLCGYTALALVLAAFLLHRRDA